MGKSEKILTLCALAAIFGMIFGGFISLSDRDTQMRDIELAIAKCYENNQRALLIRGEVSCEKKITE